MGDRARTAAHDRRAAHPLPELGAATGAVTELRERDREDVWLYNSVAYSCAGVDERACLGGALDGIDVALETGDPEQVVMQLHECAEAAWEALGGPSDEDLVERVEAFCEQWTPGPHERRWGGPTRRGPPLRVLRVPTRHQAGRTGTSGHAGPAAGLLPAEEPRALGQLDAAAGEPEPRAATPRPMKLAFAWFPSDEWPEAIERWPDLLDDLPADHREYSHAMEARIKRVSWHVHGHPLHVAPMTVDEPEA